MVTFGINDCFTVFLTTFIKSDNDDCMIQTVPAAVIRWLDHTALVELEC